MKFKGKTQLKNADNHTVYNRIARKRLRCDRCRPHRGENKDSHSVHGAKKLNKTKRGKEDKDETQTSYERIPPD